MFNVPYLTSCNHCREKKRKCNGEKPTCSLCRAHGVACEYRRSHRFRKRAQNTHPLQPLMPGPEPPVHHAGFTSGSQAMGPASAPIGSAQTFGKQYSQPSVPMFVPQSGLSAPCDSQFPQKQFPTPGALPEMDALSRLLAGDMYPQTQQLPLPILQGVNTFMSPFSDARSQSIPEWISQQKPEAAIISNLENIASAYHASPVVPALGEAQNGNALGLSSQLMLSGGLFQPNQLNFGAQSAMPTNGVQSSAVPSNAFAIPNMLAPANGVPVSTSLGQQRLVGSSSPAQIYRRPSSLVSSNHDADANWSGSPGSMRPMYTTRSPSTGARSDNSVPLSNMFSPPTESTKRTNVHDSAKPAPIPTYSDDFVPEVIQIYAREFPGTLSPSVLLRVMRGICSSTRTSLINVDLEIAWCMVLKGIIPRILLFAYIASMARGQAIDAELMPLLPAQFDELCYEVAIKDVPLATQSPSLWGALSLHLIGRYEFQSARYDLMTTHYEMATDMLCKTKFHGYEFPWKDVPAHLRNTFEYDYYVYTFWVGFQWHLVSCFNLDRPFNVDIDPNSMPVPATRGYFASDLPCGFDLLTLLPANSWPQSTQTAGVDKVWFRGFNDAEYAGWRPREWQNIMPNYKITMYLQRMLPLGAQLYQLQCQFGNGTLSLAEYLQRLHAQQELLKRWMYSLPEEFELTLAKVTQFTNSTPRSSGENTNLLMDFKELIMMYALYSTFMIRANRVALLGMLDENLAAPATSMGMRVFGLRDYFEAVAQTGHDHHFDGNISMWQKNLAFHSCRMLCYESMDILCDVVQLSFILRLDLFTYGTSYVAIAGEMLNVLISQLGVDDANEKWKTKKRLGHVLCLLRSLQHWAPALYMFVYGIQALSDPSIVLDVDDMKKHEAEAAVSGVPDVTTPIHIEERRSDKAANDTEMPNPFPPNHIINLIVADLDVSLATFLAPAYPMLLLKIFASKV
ncbi:hypothetical protein LPJ77_002309 [Coemansia sp. RSA 2523]|nr:hypothetical protein LPJ54_001809 [Coemansia sp. RSA 1824]KAJ1808485.1 hypothetical protein LPJ77_002309 [Coemansia sp. RSA 2523]KAJ2652981.1 hypothetical protein IW137_000082 [Coemansia sp. RSA 1287]